MIGACRVARHAEQACPFQIVGRAATPSHSQTAMATATATAPGANASWHYFDFLHRWQEFFAAWSSPVVQDILARGMQQWCAGRGVTCTWEPGGALWPHSCNEYWQRAAEQRAREHAASQRLQRRFEEAMARLGRRFPNRRAAAAGVRGGERRMRCCLALRCQNWQIGSGRPLTPPPTAARAAFDVLCLPALAEAYLPQPGTVEWILLMGGRSQVVSSSGFRMFVLGGWSHGVSMLSCKMWVGMVVVVCVSPQDGTYAVLLSLAMHPRTALPL